MRPFDTKIPSNDHYIYFSDVYSGLSGGWVAGVADTNQYLEVDMNLPYKFTKVHIQGRQDADEWVTSFKIFYYTDGTSSWDEYTHSNGQNVIYISFVIHINNHACIIHQVFMNATIFNYISHRRCFYTSRTTCHSFKFIPTRMKHTKYEGNNLQDISLSYRGVGAAVLSF